MNAGSVDASTILSEVEALGTRIGRVRAAIGRVIFGHDEVVDQTLITLLSGGHALLVGYLSEAYLLAGRVQEAVQLAGRALDLSLAHNERGYQAWALRLLGEIAAHQAPPEVEPAANRYRQALALAEELGMRPLVAHCHLGLSRLYGQIGRAEQARTALTIAITLYRAMEMTFWLPQAEAALAQVG